MTIGLYGLGNMGLNLALRLQEQGHTVIASNRSPQKRQQATTAGMTNVVGSLAEVVEQLQAEDRVVIWLMVSAGSAVDSVLFDQDGLADLLPENSIVIDGANSHFRDTKRRAKLLADNGISYLDCGVSGGIDGARTGACLMIGGDKSTYEYCAEIFSAAAQPEGYGYFGNSGAGHFVKMVHNGIEYGMMQAIAEGLNLIHHSDYQVDLTELTKVWNHGSIIESNLVGFIQDAFNQDQDLANTDPEIGSLGTGRWTVEQALEMGVPLPAITSAVYARYQSRDPKSFIFKVVQAMRAQFGGHTSTERPSV